MSMSPEQENFEQLRRLLVLKRHEQPPPGYFDRFSGNVVAAIRAGARPDRDSALERLLYDAPWMRRFWQAFQAKPILAGGFGVFVCGLLVTGVVFSDRPDAARPAVALATPQPEPSAGLPAAPGLMPAALLEPAPGTDVSSVGGAASLGNSGSLFDQLPPPRVSLISETVPAGN